MIECNDSVAREIIEKALGGRKICEPFRGLTIKNGQDPIGAIILNNFDCQDVHITVAKSGHVSQEDVDFVAKYVFKQLDCRRCTAITSELNMAARRALLRLGFKHEGTLREHFDEADGFVYGLLRSEQNIVKGL